MSKIQKRVFFGYDRNALGEFIIWEEQAEVVRYIFATVDILLHLLQMN